MEQKLRPARRRFLEHSALGLLGLAIAPSWLSAMDMSSSRGGGGTQPNPSFKPDVELELIAREEAVSILDGPKTQVLRYTARLITGPKEVLTELPGSYLGPLIRLQQGQKVRIQFRHELSEPTITHWHGLHVPAEMDGHPHQAISKGETRVYEFEVLNRAGFHIYHPHPHGATASQVYMGLAGGLIIHDPEEAKLGLPSGDYEIPLVLQDRSFDRNNQLVYASNMHERMLGFAGDQILVNGRPGGAIEVASRAYRLRIMNGSNARIYKLGWSDGSNVIVIGVDGGLLEAPERYPYVMLAPGERLDVWADFSGQSLGTVLTLGSLPFKGVLPRMATSMGGGRMGASKLPIGSAYPIVTFKVTQKMSDSPTLPMHLSRYPHYRLDQVMNKDRPIPIAIKESPMAMLLNGQPYGQGGFQPFERVPVNSLQLIEIFHDHAAAMEHGESSVSPKEALKKPSGMGGMGHQMMGMGGMNHEAGSREGGMGMMDGGMMMSMAHPIHLHGQQFQVISRTIGMGEEESYGTVKNGLMSSGYKDTVLVMPGERVRLIKPFNDFKGVFMYHCHNLEHEDMGMMREFEVY